jgi:hypothetical protein
MIASHRYLVFYIRSFLLVGINNLEGEEAMKIFLSGKVDEHGGWRDWLLGMDYPDKPRWVLVNKTQSIEVNPLVPWVVKQGIVLDTHDYVGAYKQVYSEDFPNKWTGIYHGSEADGGHGQMSEESANSITAKCKSAIRGCDLLFAYINTPDCYGSLVEIGYAAAFGKCICLAVNKHIPGDCAWFAEHFSSIAVNVDYRSPEEEKAAVTNALLRGISLASVKIGARG